MYLLLSIIAVVIVAYITWDMTRATWRCFHCGFCTDQEDEAQAHFGYDERTEPICLLWNSLIKEDRLAEFQAVVQERDAVREEIRTLRRENETLEFRIGSLESDIESRFPGCRSLLDVWCKMDSMRGEVLVAREQAASDEFWKRACMDTPAEFIQRELWQYKQLIETLMEVYPYISGGKLISLDTTAAGVKKAVDAYYNSKSLYTNETGRPMTPSERVRAVLNGVSVSHVDLTRSENS